MVLTSGLSAMVATNTSNLPNGVTSVTIVCIVAIRRRKQMKLSKSTERKVLGKWVSFGYHLRRFSLEFTIDKYALNVSLGFIWLSVEF